MTRSRTIRSPPWTMDASAAAIAAKLRRPQSFVLPSTEPRSSSIPAVGTDALLLYACASSAGCSDAAKPAGSPLRKTVGFFAFLPFSLREKVAGEARRMRVSRRRTLPPDPSPVARRETGVLPNALWEEGRRADD